MKGSKRLRKKKLYGTRRSRKSRAFRNLKEAVAFFTTGSIGAWMSSLIFDAMAKGEPVPKCRIEIESPKGGSALQVCPGPPRIIP